MHERLFLLASILDRLELFQRHLHAARVHQVLRVGDDFMQDLLARVEVAADIGQYRLRLLFVFAQHFAVDGRSTGSPARELISEK